MKVILYAVPTLNGMIAKATEKDYSFISDKSWNRYLQELKSAGVFVMGRRTYEASLRSGAFPYDCVNVVMTKKNLENKWGEKVIFTDLEPKKVVEMLKNKNFSTVIVTGGHLNSSFIKAGLVDEIWVHLMPKIFTGGINLFEGDDFEVSLKLIDNINTGDGEVLLKYKLWQK